MTFLFFILFHSNKFTQYNESYILLNNSVSCPEVWAGHEAITTWLWLVQDAIALLSLGRNCVVPEARHSAARPAHDSDAERRKRANENWLYFLSIACNHFRRAIFSNMAPKNVVIITGPPEHRNKAIVLANRYKHRVGNAGMHLMILYLLCYVNNLYLYTSIYTI